MSRLTNVVINFEQTAVFTPEPFHAFVAERLCEAGYEAIAGDYLDGCAEAATVDAAISYADSFVTLYETEHLHLFNGLDEVVDFCAAPSGARTARAVKTWEYERTTRGHRKSLEKLMGGRKCTESGKVKAIGYLGHILQENESYLDADELALRRFGEDKQQFIEALGELTDEIGMAIIHLLPAPYSKLIDFKNNELWLQALIKRYPKMIITVKQTLERCLVAVRSKGMALEWIVEPCQLVIEEALKKDGQAIQFVTDPTEKMKVYAVRSNDRALGFIANHTEELVMEAVRKDGDALKWSTIQTPEIVGVAVRRSPCSIQYVREELLTQEVVEGAVYNGYFAYRYVIDRLTPALVDHVMDNAASFETLGKMPHITPYALSKCFEATTKGRKSGGRSMRETRDKLLNGDCENFFDLTRLDTDCIAVFLRAGGKVKALPQLEDPNAVLQVLDKEGRLLRKFEEKTATMCYRAVMSEPDALEFVPKEYR